WCALAKMIGAVTLLTMAAVTGSRYSFGGRGAALQQTRLSETMASRRVRILEVYAVADADEQPRRVADLQSRRVLAKLGTALDLQDVSVALVVEVAIGCIEDRRVASVGFLALEQHSRTNTPRAEYRVS